MVNISGIPRTGLILKKLWKLLELLIDLPMLSNSTGLEENDGRGSKVLVAKAVVDQWHDHKTSTQLVILKL